MYIAYTVIHTNIYMGTPHFQHLNKLSERTRYSCRYYYSSLMCDLQRHRRRVSVQKFAQPPKRRQLISIESREDSERTGCTYSILYIRG